MSQPQPAVGVPEETPSTHYIAEQFVRQYYVILQNSPWLLHHFYQDMSTFSVQYHGAAPFTVQGAAMIGTKIQEILPNPISPAVEGKETSCQIKNIRWMHQVAPGSSLVVAVSGSQVNIKNGQSQRFFQTFVLASEPGQANAYFVHNDMCCFEPDVPMQPMQPPPPQMMVQQPNGAPPTAAMPHAPVPQGLVPGPQGLVPMSPPGAKPKAMVVPAPAPVEVPKEPNPPTPEKESNSPKFGTVPEEQQLPAPASLDIGKPTIPASAAAAAAAAAAPKANPTEDAPKAAAAAAAAAEGVAEEPSQKDEAKASPEGPMSWAAMASRNKPEIKPAPAPKPPRKAAAAAEGSEEKAGEAAAAPVSEEAPPPRKERVPYTKPQESELDASVFVSGVPNTCGEERLKEIFGKHGEVVKVSLKAEKHFAIIDFNSQECAVKALKTAAIKCDDSIMKVEPRRKSGAAKSRGKGEGRNSEGRGRGRGRGDGSKGGRKPTREAN